MTNENFKNINTLEQLIAYVLDLIGKDSVEEIRKCENLNEFIGFAHFSLGMSLRNHLKLWEEGSHLYNFFKDTYGLLHADDMSGIILKKLYKVVMNDLTNDWITGEIQSYKDHWARAENLKIEIE